MLSTLEVAQRLIVIAWQLEAERSNARGPIAEDRRAVLAAQDRSAAIEQAAIEIGEQQARLTARFAALLELAGDDGAAAWEGARAGVEGERAQAARWGADWWCL